ncbi:MAG: PAS domain-containing sensor histidine kinase [Bacteroidales bacterium]|nr:PAS domain-containing sensor histidine kinase [Bacteroidales bacterium]
MKAVTDQVAIAIDRTRYIKNLMDRTLEAEEGKRLLDAIMDYVPEGITIAEAGEFKPSRISKYGKKILGHFNEKGSLTEYTETFKTFYPNGEAMPKDEFPLIKALEGKVVKDFEFFQENSSGTFMPFLCSAAPIYNNIGELTGAIAVWRDITERKKLIKQLNAERELFETIFNKIPVPNLNVSHLNKAVEDITGWTQKDNDEKGIMNLTYPDDKYRETVMGFMNSLQPGFREIKMVCKDGREINTLWANIEISDGRRVGIGIDISERLEYEKQLTKAINKITDNEQLEKMNRLHENLLYVISHDLRNPIANMFSLIDLITNIPQIENKLSLMDRMKEMVQKQENIIKGLTEIIEVQTPEEVKSTMLFFDEIIKEIIHENEADLTACKGIVKCDFKAAPHIQHVYTFLVSILKNLITNAIKYRDDSRNLVIEIESRKVDQFVLVMVKDNGIGIDLEKYGKKLFEPFRRFTKKAYGTGIGLYLIKSLIEKNGGFITVESNPSVGTKFNCYFAEYEELKN